MMPAPRAPFEIAKEMRAPLSVIERIALECIRQIASEGRVATQPELCAATGVTYQSGAITAILKRLESKGYITRQSYQRGMKVCIPALGICTAEPANTSPHWRDLPRQPSITIQTLRQRAPEAAMTVEQVARADGRDLPDLLAELVRRGLADKLAERNEQ